MGTHEYPNLGKKELDLRNCADVLVVASRMYIGSLTDALRSEAFPGLVIHEAEAWEAVPQTVLQSASLVVVEVDPADPRSTKRLTAINQSTGSTPVIAAIPDGSVALVRALVREGVADVIALPFEADDLLEAALNALAKRSTRQIAETKLAPMIAVVRSVGGSGATTIATHLAAELGAASPDKTGAVIVDLDLQLGSVAEVLSARGRASINDLLSAEARLDDELVRSVARTTDDGVAVIAAPDELVPIESVSADALLRVLQQVRRCYSHVVLDLPADWTNWSLAAALEADLVILVVDLSLASLRQAKRRLELFSSVGVPGSHIAVVVNRFEKRLFRTIGLDDVSETLKFPVIASLSLDEPTVTHAQEQGRLVTGLHGKSRFGKDIARLAEALLEGQLGGAR
ncbi:MAG: AAA family ATPase [Sphingomonadales bacterium]|nr:AAA family ATPase [Sphingomonadales bacterium]MDE2568023.1 AAA family ATPase [Sphingomonadales bacterium]